MAQCTTCRGCVRRGVFCRAARNTASLFAATLAICKKHLPDTASLISTGIWHCWAS